MRTRGEKEQGKRGERGRENEGKGETDYTFHGEEKVTEKLKRKKNKENEAKDEADIKPKRIIKRKW